MKQTIRLLLTVCALAIFSTVASAEDGAVGVWQTESSDKGYLHVSMEPCDDAMCGTILDAYDLDGEPMADYEHKGKNMVWGMKGNNGTSWKGGKIWDPSADKTYKSKMSVSGDVLSVSGCVLMFCKSQKWTRVK